MQDNSQFPRFQARPRLSDFEVEEKATEAEALLQNKVFLDAMDRIYAKALGILLDSDVGGLTAGSAHATLKAIGDIYNQLNEYVTDRKMRQKYSKGEPHG